MSRHSVQVPVECLAMIANAIKPSQWRYWFQFGECTMSEVTTFKHGFNFRAVPKTAEKFETIKAAMVAAGVPFAEVKEINGKAAEGIQRTAFDADLPLVSIVDLASHSPEFVQSIVNGLVAETARKLYVDQFKPLGAITVADIVAANTPKAREAALPKELLESFCNYVKAVMEAKGVKAGTIATVLELCRDKFTSKVLNKHIKQQGNYPVILEKLVGYVTDAADEATIVMYTPVLEAYAENYQRWVGLQSAETEELDASAM